MVLVSGKNPSPLFCVPFTQDLLALSMLSRWGMVPSQYRLLLFSLQRSLALVSGLTIRFLLPYNGSACYASLVYRSHGWPAICKTYHPYLTDHARNNSISLVYLATYSTQNLLQEQQRRGGSYPSCSVSRHRIRQDTASPFERQLTVARVSAERKKE